MQYSRKLGLVATGGQDGSVCVYPDTLQGIYHRLWRSDLADSVSMAGMNKAVHFAESLRKKAFDRIYATRPRPSIIPNTYHPPPSPLPGVSCLEFITGWSTLFIGNDIGSGTFQYLTAGTKVRLWKGEICRGQALTSALFHKDSKMLIVSTSKGRVFGFKLQRLPPPNSHTRRTVHVLRYVLTESMGDAPVYSIIATTNNTGITYMSIFSIASPPSLRKDNKLEAGGSSSSSRKKKEKKNPKKGSTSSSKRRVVAAAWESKDERSSEKKQFPSSSSSSSSSPPSPSSTLAASSPSLFLLVAADNGGSTMYCVHSGDRIGELSQLYTRDLIERTQEEDDAASAAKEGGGWDRTIDISQFASEKLASAKSYLPAVKKAKEKFAAEIAAKGTRPLDFEALARDLTHRWTIQNPMYDVREAYSARSHKDRKHTTGWLSSTRDDTATIMVRKKKKNGRTAKGVMNRDSRFKLRKAWASSASNPRQQQQRQQQHLSLSGNNKGGR